MKRWWLSFYACVPLKHFEYHGPWWISGEICDTVGTQIVCLAVVARDESSAIEIIRRAYDHKKRPAILDLRFCEERSAQWKPFTDRFPKANWMRWPWPTGAKEDK